MWGQKDYGGPRRAECIYQTFSALTAGNTYTIKLNYKTLGTPDEICIWLTDGVWNPAPTTAGACTIPTMNYQDMFAGNALQTPQANFTADQTTFTVDANNTYTRLVIFPNNPTNTSQNWLHVDCIELVPSETVTITPNPSYPIFKGIPVTLTAALSGNYTGVSYDWNTSATSAAIIVTPAVTTTYSVTVTYANNCTATEQIQVVVDDAGPDRSMCSGTAVQIGSTALTSHTYSWTPSGTLYTSNIPQPMAAPSTTTTYTVTVTHSGNTATDDVIVNVTPITYNSTIPVPYISATSISNNNCSGNTITYNVYNTDPDYTYTWSITPGSGTFTSPVATPPIPIMATSVTINWTNIPLYGATLHVVAINNTNCNYNYYDYTIFNCCTEHNPDYSFLDETISQYGTSFTNQVIVINGTLEIDDDVTWENCDVYLGPDAKIEINGGYTLEINTGSRLTDCDDANMWDGIYITGANNFVIIDDSEILNAKNAIVSLDGGVFEITNSYLEQNYKGIVIKGYGAIHNGYIENTIINTSNYLISPYINQRGRFGIECDDVQYIVIGDSTNSDYNTFSNLDYGIYSKDSYIRVVDNHFVDIEYQQSYTFPGSGNTKPTGIYSYGSIGGAKVYIGGDNSGGNYKSNYFEDCEYGVSTQNNEYVAIAGNEFDYTNQNNGFHPAISTTNTTQTTDPHKIVGNIITSYRRGITCTNNLESTIECNEITNIPNPSTQGPTDICFGISTYACSDNINYNIIEGNSTTDLRVKGISININDATTLKCNDITDVGIAMFAGGNNGECDFQKDYLRDSDVGLYLNHATGYIGPQGSGGNPCDINFIGTFTDDTYTNDADGSNSPLEVRTTPTFPYQPISNGTNNVSFTINTTSGTGISCGGSYCDDLLADYYSMKPSPGISLSLPAIGNNLYSLSPVKLAQFIKVIQDSIPFTSFIPESQWLSKYHLFNYFIKNNMNLGNICINFMAASANNSIGKTNRVHSLIDSNKYIQATSVNNSIVCTNKIDSSYKYFNGLYLDKIAGKSEIIFDSGEMASLACLALKCPYEYGSAVYSARLVLRNSGDSTHYFNYCEAAFSNNEQKSYWFTEEDNNYVYSTKLYPNPAGAYCTLESIIPEGQTGKFFIMNLMGERILIHDLHEGVNNLNFSTEQMETGFYLWKVEINGDKIETGKLLINK